MILTELEETKAKLGYPAQAGMILCPSFAVQVDCCYPCTSGDDPRAISAHIKIGRLSLHKRG